LTEFAISNVAIKRRKQPSETCKPVCKNPLPPPPPSPHKFLGVTSETLGPEIKQPSDDFVAVPAPCQYVLLWKIVFRVILSHFNNSIMIVILLCWRLEIHSTYLLIYLNNMCKASLNLKERHIDIHA
jgi:hypothetical protein